MNYLTLPLIGTIAIIGLTHLELAHKVADDLIQNYKRSDLNVITPDMRDDVFTCLKRYAHGLDPETGRDTGDECEGTARFLLIRLGDEQMIEEEMKEKDEVNNKLGKLPIFGANGDNYTDSAQTLLIPYLAKDVSREDGNKVILLTDDTHTGQPWYPVSIGSAKSIVGIMKNSPAFNPAVREWAVLMFDAVGIDHYYKSGIDIVGFRQIMRDWWRENEQFFQAKNYAAVKPGALLTEAAPATSLPPASSETAKPINTPTPSSSHASAPSFYLPITIGLAALFIGIVVFLFRSRK